MSSDLELKELKLNELSLICSELAYTLTKLFFLVDKEALSVAEPFLVSFSLSNPKVLSDNNRFLGTRRPGFEP